MSLKFVKNKNGFSLIELLVVISIIGLMSSVMVANYRSGQRSSDLNAAAQKMVSNIRLAQHYAMGLKDSGIGDETIGWGVFIDKSTNSYIIFADIIETPNHNKNRLYDNGSGSSVDEKYLSVSLSANISIDSISFGGNEINYVFQPPRPKITICDHNASCPESGDDSEAEIILKNKVGQTRKIKINKFGLVEIE